MTKSEMRQEIVMLRQELQEYAAIPPVRVEADVGLADCLAEINNALNYWYPLKSDASEDERNARHVRLFQFRDRLARQLKANDKTQPTSAAR